ncbi:MAG: hypothetical protein RIG82_04170 [Phycisphaeraceae bacterium]
MDQAYCRYLYLDINGYFASVEQQLRPELRGKPVAVVPVDTDSTCCIASSYEAKAFGVKTGTPVPEARRLCPGVRFVLARHERYVRMHHQIIAAMERCVHVDEVCSIDEMCARLMSNERSAERALEIARAVKGAIAVDAGLYVKCSVGVGPNQWLAKVATDLQKPDGLVVLTPEDVPKRLFCLALDDLPGIGRRMHARLGRVGVTTVEQLCGLSESALQTIWGSRVLGSQWYLQLRGEQVDMTPTRRRTVGHSHVLSPEYRTREGALRVMVHMIHKAGRRMRRLGYHAGRMHLGMRYVDGSRWVRDMRLPDVSDTVTLVRMCSAAWPGVVSAVPLKVSVTLMDLTLDQGVSGALFGEQRAMGRIAEAMDRIERRFGNNAVFPGAMLGALDSAPTRISFTQIPELIDCDPPTPPPRTPPRRGLPGV